MTAKVLDGKALAKQIESELKIRIKNIKEKSGGLIPVLATILVGNDPASTTYVKMKGNACKRIGMDSLKIILPDNTSTEALLLEINKLNVNPDVHGILLQHPVPSQINERECFNKIILEKGVDGVTCLGFGRMAMGENCFGAATPVGIMKLLSYYKIDIAGKRAVIVGRSPILGKPLALMLLNRHATVTICHSKTKDLPDIVKQADIIVGALGKPEFIKGAWIKDGAIVLDAGYNPGNVGDIELSQIINRCSAYTPVPGGVGPMTIATLISQTVEAFENNLDHFK
jgi:methylenetetrahydrofolate dehydrogenase (NADP+)/methenyltetrahydrofolate cyclohydrolase